MEGPGKIKLPAEGGLFKIVIVAGHGHIVSVRAGARRRIDHRTAAHP